MILNLYTEIIYKITMSKIYKMHIRGIWDALVPFSVALVFLFIIGNIVFSNYITPFFFEKKFLKQNAFSCVFESNKQPQDYERTLRKLKGLITFMGGHNKQMNARVYIQTGTAFPIDHKLQAEEIAISKKMAKKLDISKGDNVLAEFISDMPVKNYRVKEVFPYMSDFYDVRDSEYFSAVIVGQESTLANYIHSQWVYFTNEQKCQSFLQGEISFNKSKNIKLEIEELESVWVLGNVVWGMLLFILVGVIIVRGHFIICRETLKYYYDGFDAKIIKKMEWTDHLFFLGLPIVGEMLWMSIHYQWFASYVFWGIILGMPLLLGTIVWFGGKKYGKVV